VAMPFDRLTEAADALESRDPAEIAAVVDRAPNNWTGTYAVVVLAEICPECRSVGRLQLWKGEILATGAVKKTDSMTEYFEMRGPELGQLMALTESPPTEASGSSS